MKTGATVGKKPKGKVPSLGKPHTPTPPSKPVIHRFIHTCPTGHRIVLVIESLSQWRFGRYRIHWPNGYHPVDDAECQSLQRTVEGFLSATTGRSIKLKPDPSPKK
jgi:hypothetical protein